MNKGLKVKFKEIDVELVLGLTFHKFIMIK